MRELVDPVGVRVHRRDTAKNSRLPERNPDRIAPVASFDNVRRIGQETADILTGALEWLAMPVGKQKHLTSFGNARLVMVAPEGKPERLHSLAGKTAPVQAAAGG